MPQIANQDYNIIRPVLWSFVNEDTPALMQLAAAKERGTIFDVLVEKPTEDANGLYRIVSVEEPYLWAQGRETVQISAVYNSRQYHGMSVIQEKLPNHPYPDLYRIMGDERPYLADSHNDTYICVDGYVVEAQVNAAVIFTGFSITNIKVETLPDGDKFINVPAEILPELIGIDEA